MPDPSDNGGKRTTIMDIAERLHISPTTVTKALNGKPKVSDALREEVFRVAKEMQYRPNRSARALSINERTIGIIYPVEPREFYEHVERGVRDEAANLRDFRVNSLLYPVKGLNDVHGVVDALEALYDREIDGLVFSPGLNSPGYASTVEKLAAFPYHAPAWMSLPPVPAAQAPRRIRVRLFRRGDIPDE